MATLKVYDGTQWQPVAGQGSPGQGIPSGGSTGTLLVKNSAASLDTSWTDPTMRLVGNALCVGTAPSSMDSANVRLRVNANPALTNGALQVAPTAAAYPAADFYGAASQSNAIVTARDNAGTVGWFVDRYARPKQFIQAGNIVGNTDPNGLLYISFPEAFLSTPHVVCNETSDIRAFCYSIHANQSTTGMLVRVLYHDGAPVGGGVRINWIAFELRS
jgi:hypothetical protein